MCYGCIAGKTAQMSFLGALLAWRLEESSRKAEKLRARPAIHCRTSNNDTHSNTDRHSHRPPSGHTLSHPDDL